MPVVPLFLVKAVCIEFSSKRDSVSCASLSWACAARPSTTCEFTVPGCESLDFKWLPTVQDREHRWNVVGQRLGIGFLPEEVTSERCRVMTRSKDKSPNPNPNTTLSPKMSTGRSSHAHCLGTEEHFLHARGRFNILRAAASPDTNQLADVRERIARLGSQPGPSSAGPVAASDFIFCLHTSRVGLCTSAQHGCGRGFSFCVRHSFPRAHCSGPIKSGSPQC